jgi:AcrR family transcriptional regulator
MITANGLHGLTMHKLAAANGLTAGALYRYFSSKAEIISALEGQVLRGLSERLAVGLVGLPTDADAQCLAIHRLSFCAHFYLQQSIERPEQASLIAMLLADPRHHVSDRELPEVSVDFVSLFGQLVAELVAAESGGALAPGNANRRALVFWSSLQGICSTAKLQRVDADFFDPMRAGEELTRALLLGWGVDAALVSKPLPHFDTTPLATQDKPS